MNGLIAKLIGLVLIYLASATAAQAVQIRIDPAGYRGLWTLDYGIPRRGPAIVELGEADPTTGSHVIEIGGSELQFSLDASGAVTVENRYAALGGARSLRFNTIPITVNPVYFQGRWRVVDGATPELSGIQRVVLVRGLSFYSMSLGANGGFFFHVAPNGRVIVPNDHAGRGGLRKLRLNNTERFMSTLGTAAQP